MGLQRVGCDWATFTHDHRMAAAHPRYCFHSHILIWVSVCDVLVRALLMDPPQWSTRHLLTSSLWAKMKVWALCVVGDCLGDGDPRIYSQEARSRFWPSVSPSSLSQRSVHSPCPINMCWCTAVGVTNAGKKPRTLMKFEWMRRKVNLPKNVNIFCFSPSPSLSRGYWQMLNGFSAVTSLCSA